MTNSGETEKAYAGQQGECALWKARSLAALEEYNGQVCSKYFYCWSEDLVDASVSAESRAAAATATQKAREDTAWLDGGQHRKAEAAAVRVAAEEAERRRVEDYPATNAVAKNVERQRVGAEAAGKQ